MTACDGIFVGCVVVVETGDGGCGGGSQERRIIMVGKDVMDISLSSISQYRKDCCKWGSVYDTGSTGSFTSRTSTVAPENWLGVTLHIP